MECLSCTKTNPQPQTRIIAKTKLCACILHILFSKHLCKHCLTIKQAAHKYSIRKAKIKQSSKRNHCHDHKHNRSRQIFIYVNNSNTIKLWEKQPSPHTKRKSNVLLPQHRYIASQNTKQPKKCKSIPCKSHTHNF